MCILGFLKNSRDIIVFALHCGGAGRNSLKKYINGPINNS